MIDLNDRAKCTRGSRWRV